MICAAEKRIEFGCKGFQYEFARGAHHQLSAQTHAGGLGTKTVKAHTPRRRFRVSEHDIAY
jgi:hypothetical protein